LFLVNNYLISNNKLRCTSSDPDEAFTKGGARRGLECSDSLLRNFTQGLAHAWERYGQWEAIKASIAPLNIFKITEGQLHEGQKSFQVEGTSCQESKAVAANVATGVISELRHLGAQPTVGMAKQGRARSMWPRPWPMVSSTASPLILDLVGLNDPGEAKRPQAVASRVDQGRKSARKAACEAYVRRRRGAATFALAQGSIGEFAVYFCRTPSIGVPNFEELGYAWSIQEINDLRCTWHRIREHAFEYKCSFSGQKA